MKKEPIITVEDNFLGKDEFEALTEIMFSTDISWQYVQNATYSAEHKGMANKFAHTVDEEEAGDNYAPSSFNHLFWGYTGFSVEWSEHYNDICIQFIKMLNIPLVTRIKANLLIRRDKHAVGRYHTDIISENRGEEKLYKRYYSAIYYVNTCNGYTELLIAKDKTRKIESVANRLVIFPANMLHRPVGQTDEEARIVINFLFIF